LVIDSRAELDFDGDDQADDSSALAISDAEREQLAGRYAAGQELWRVPVSHFTPWDFKREFEPLPTSTLFHNATTTQTHRPHC
jgi:hypothetical protein